MLLLDISCYPNKKQFLTLSAIFSNSLDSIWISYGSYIVQGVVINDLNFRKYSYRSFFIYDSLKWTGQTWDRRDIIVTFKEKGTQADISGNISATLSQICDV